MDYILNFLKNLFKKKPFKDYTKHPEFIGRGCIDGFGSNDFLAGKVLGKISEEYLTDEDFKTDGDILYLIHQGWTDFCVFCQTAYGVMKSEFKKISWTGGFKLLVKMLSYLPDYGTTVENGSKVHIKFGLPEAELDEFKEKKSRVYNADPNNLTPEAIKNAEEHKGISYFRIQPDNLDMFDTVRAWLNRYRNKNLYIKSGIDGHALGWDRQYTIKQSGDIPIFNDLKATDNDLIKAGLKVGTMYLIGPDSYGENNGDYRLGRSIKGWRWWSKNEVNANYYGYFDFDMPRSLVEILNKYANKAVKGTTNKVYLIKNGKKCWIPDEETAWVYDIKLWYDVETINDDELDLIPDGNALRFSEAPLENRKLLTEILNSPNILERLKAKLNET